ncbi:MAG: signal recognition particle-docking protein FtsY [Verrucomicrobiota bacterium]
MARDASFLVKQGILSKGHVDFWRGLVHKFDTGEEIDWEALLLEADLGLPLTERLVEQIEDEHAEKSLRKGLAILREEIRGLVVAPPPIPVPARPEVILLIGVNGSGKTTTAAKLAKQAQDAGKRVMFGAGDTFRAAAIEQLQSWGRRLEIPVVAREQGSDSAAVAYQAMDEATEAGADLLIIDTAGRQANKSNLMQELAKVKRTIAKKDEAAPHHTWLVVDANTGNNILNQAREFHAGVGLTGMIMTKIEGSGKGGMVAAVREEVGLPTHYLGFGEQPEDLRRFDPADYVEEFFGDVTPETEEVR